MLVSMSFLPGPQQSPGDARPGWGDITKHVAELLCQGRPFVETAKGEIEQDGRTHDNLNERGEAFLCRKCGPSRGRVVRPVFDGQLSAAHRPEDTFAGERIEEAGCITHKHVAGASPLA